MSDRAENETEKLFKSRLGQGREGFLANVLVYGLECGDRTPEDFLKHFPARAIMKALEQRPIERARILVATTGVNEKIALRQSADAAGEMLEISLAEKVTNPAAILAEFHHDDRVQYLEHAKLWAYATESTFWTRESKDKDIGRAEKMVAFILDTALANLLLSHAQVVTALTMDRLAKDLPQNTLGTIIQAALAFQDKFDEVQFLKITPPDRLVLHVSLAYIWEKVVEPIVVKELKLVDTSTKAIVEGATSVVSEGDVAEPKPAATDPTKTQAWYDSLPSNEKPTDEKPKPASEPPPSIEVSVGSLAPPKA